MNKTDINDIRDQIDVFRDIAAALWLINEGRGVVGSGASVTSAIGFIHTAIEDQADKLDNMLKEITA